LLSRPFETPGADGAVPSVKSEVRRIPHNSRHGRHISGKQLEEVALEHEDPRSRRSTLLSLPRLGFDAHYAFGRVCLTKLCQPVDDRAHEGAIACGRLENPSVRVANRPADEERR
jgi:hypothetical protein